MKIYLLACAVILVSPVFAQEPMETDRPDQTECSSIVPLHNLQIETGIVYTRNGKVQERYNYPTTLFRLGLLPSAELRIIGGEWQAENQRLKDSTSTKGFQPVEIGTKIAVCQEKGIRPQTAFIGHLAFVPGDKQTKNRQAIVPNFRFSMSHSLTEIFSLGYNLGMEWEPFSAYPVYVYTATFGASLNEKVYAYAEVFGDLAYASYPGCQADGGLSYQPLRNLQFDVSAGLGLNDHSDDLYLSFGISWRLPR
ncbi:MAG: hypothetical protein JWO09_396 [Bacteroidetes bacterium]|nr:hypothetical protein [Bacteroidota bacterium]